MNRLRDLDSLAHKAARQGMAYKACERDFGHDYRLPIERKLLGGKEYPGLRCRLCTIWKAFESDEEATAFAKGNAS